MNDVIAGLKSVRVDRVTETAALSTSSRMFGLSFALEFVQTSLLLLLNQLNVLIGLLPIHIRGLPSSLSPSVFAANPFVERRNGVIFRVLPEFLPPEPRRQFGGGG